MEELTQDFIGSLERMNMFFYVHNENKELLMAVAELYEKLEKNPEAMVSSQALRNWLDRAEDHTQTVDALMHIAQRHMIGEARVWLDAASEEEQKDMQRREETQTPVIKQMTEILLETSEERTQRILLEHLGMHHE
jgi:hypothetical protein